MLKKLIGLVCLALSISCAYAQNTGELIEYTHEFQPNAPESFSNPFFWSVDGQCYANLNNDTVTFRAHVKNNTGTLNGQQVKEGQVVYVTVSHGQNMYISASGWATVEITNLSEAPVKVTCKV